MMTGISTYTIRRKHSSLLLHSSHSSFPSGLLSCQGNLALSHLLKQPIQEGTVAKGLVWLHEVFPWPFINDDFILNVFALDLGLFYSLLMLSCLFVLSLPSPFLCLARLCTHLEHGVCGNAVLHLTFLLKQ